MLFEDWQAFLVVSNNVVAVSDQIRSYPMPLRAGADVYPVISTEDVHPLSQCCYKFSLVLEIGSRKRLRFGYHLVLE